MVTSEVIINNCVAIITAVYNNSAIIKFKDSNITLNPEDVQKRSNTITITKKEDVAFLDVKNQDDVLVRLGNLNTLPGYSGLGAAFTKNVNITNEPFVLYGDGSGELGEAIK